MSHHEESSYTPSPSQSRTCSSQSFLHDLLLTTPFDSRAVTSESESSLLKKFHPHAYYLNLTLFLVDAMLYHRGLKVTRDYLTDQIANQHDGIWLTQPSIHTLLPLLQLADVESRLGSILTSYASTIQIRNTLQNLYGKDSRWVYWAQRLEIKILQRGGMFERAHGVALEIYEYQKDQWEIEEEEEFKNGKKSWLRLSIMADMLVHLRKFQEAILTYEMARDQVVGMEAGIFEENFDKNPPPDQQQQEEEENDDGDFCGNFFRVQNRLIKLLIKMRRYDEAFSLTQPLLAEQKGQCGENHYTVLKTMHHLSIILKYQGNYEKALELTECLEKRMKLDRNFDTDQLYDHLNPKLYPAVEVNLAELRLFLSLPYEGLANAYYSQMFQKVLDLLGETHPVKLEMTLNLATWHMRHKKDKLEFSKQLFHTLYALQSEMWGPEDPDALWTKQFIDHWDRKNGSSGHSHSGWCPCVIL